MTKVHKIEKSTKCRLLSENGLKKNYIMMQNPEKESRMQTFQSIIFTLSQHPHDFFFLLGKKNGYE